MNRIKRFGFLATVLGMLLALPGLAAAQSYWYFGGGFGHASVDEGVIDDNDSAWKLLGGFAFNENFMIEGLYADLGDASAPFGTSSVLPLLTGLNTSTWGLGVRGEIPIGERFGLYGRVGAAFWDADTAFVSATGINTTTDSGTDVYFGVGGRLKFNEAVSLFLDFDRYTLDVADYDMWSLGLEFDFGRR